MIIGEKSRQSFVVPLLECLDKEIQSGEWKSVTLCSAFLTVSAAKTLIALIDDICKDAEITILVGVKNAFTVPKAVEILLEYIDERSDESNIRFVVPGNTEFHVKCYIFQNEHGGKAFVGSANLTDTGLCSRGELMIETTDQQQLDEIIEYIDTFLNESYPWQEHIERYNIEYEKANLRRKEFYPVKLFNDRKRAVRKERITIRYTAPTVAKLGIADSGQKARVALIYEKIRSESPDINKTYWIIYSGDKEYLNHIQKNYPVGSCFDRPRDSNKTWEIGTVRIIGHVGAIVDTHEGEVVIFMKKKDSVHYKVNQDIIEVAESLGIKSNEEGYIPSKRELDKYRNKILELR